jgi:N-acyl-D-amino-acid deacylase
MLIAMAAGLSLAASAFAAPPADEPCSNLIIRGGLVLDGSGAPGKLMDIAVGDDRIVRMGNLGDLCAAHEVDARGLYVSPGFISLHDHSVPEAWTTAENLLTQGITSAITNADGRGEANLDAQFQSSEGFGINIGPYIGFNAVWQSVMGLNDRRPTPAELQRMRDLVAAGIGAGAWGVSAGLDYKPAFWASTDEVIEVVRAAAATHTNFPNHERLSEANGTSSLAGIAETITIAEQAQLMPVITHMKLQAGDRGKVAELFALLDQAERRGVRVGADAYPYTYGYTGSVAQLLFPAWAQEGGRDATLARLARHELRQRTAEYIGRQIETRWTGIDGIFFPKSARSLQEVMHELDLEDAGEAVIRLYEQGDQPIILHFGHEQDVQAILADPRVAISCDCGATRAKYGHPRYWGAYPRFLGRYVREQRLMSWEEAVRRMTALPATMIGMTERGRLRPGMIADITIFDPRTIIDHATIQEPTRRSEGIRHVIINGTIALKDGIPVSARAGKLLRRWSKTPPGIVSGASRP